MEEYVALWVRRIEQTGAVDRQEWDRYWSWLEGERIACPADRSTFDRHFVRSNRGAAIPRPGLRLLLRWPLGAARASDDERALVREVRDRLDEALAAFGVRGAAGSGLA